MKTIHLESIKKIDGKPCKIIYNGAGAFEIDVDDMDGRQNLNYIIDKPVKPIQKLLLFVQETKLFVQAELVKL